MAAPLWKVGAIPVQGQANVGDLINASRNFYNNRLDILDQAVGDLQTKKNMGNITDAQFIQQLQDLANRQSQGFTGPEAPKQVLDLQNQAKQAVAQQLYNDYIAQQKAEIQKTLDSADLQYAKAQDDYTQGRINRDEFVRQRDVYFNLQKNRADLENTLPKFSYQQFAPGTALNTYASGRMRDIERERQIRDAYQQTFGKPIDARYLYSTAGTYLPIDAIKAQYKQQKVASPGSLGAVPGVYQYAEPKYNFGGTGGAPQLPTENYQQRNYYK